MHTLHHSYNFQNLSQKLDDIFDAEPSNLGSRRLTILYKIITSRLKSMPFIYIVPLACFTALVMYLILGRLMISLVTLLQNGF